jgi:ribosome biogenesis protein NSA1
MSSHLFFFYIPLILKDSATFTCISGGILRRTSLIRDEGENNFQIREQRHVDLPSRLFDWRLSEDGLNFAYGGDEVDVSLWNTERAFQTTNSADPPQATLKRRKKDQDLYPGEVWRARNVSLST